LAGSAMTWELMTVSVTFITPGDLVKPGYRSL